MSNFDKIKSAIEPMRTAAMDQAESLVRIKIAEALDELENKHNWDRKSYAPYPDSITMSRKEFQEARAKYYFVSQITTRLKGTYTMVKDPEYCRKNEEGINRLIGQARTDASFLFDKYVLKLGKKVGEAVAYQYVEVKTDNGLWQNSNLFLIAENAAVDVWNTKMIVNCSVYGKLFLQWPTRKLKK